ncbi:MAG: hypothetical protein ACRDH6_00795 [Actinomycetota bacterium]
MEFEDALRDLGFGLEQEKRDLRSYAKRPNRFLTYSVLAYADGAALFTFEFAIAEYMATKGLQVGSDEHLNTFLYPQRDARGPQDAGWLAEQIDRTEALLESISFLAADE